MRKICYLSYHAFPTVQRGAPLYTYQLAHSFSRRNWRVVVSAIHLSRLLRNRMLHPIQTGYFYWGRKPLNRIFEKCLERILNRFGSTGYVVAEKPFVPEMEQSHASVVLSPSFEKDGGCS